jgi:uncharacterized membrane protein YdjX (TVP38/TMEM64 family)
MPSVTARRRRQPLRVSDWLRLVIPVVIIAAFMLVAWRLGYFRLENPRKLTAATDRARSIPWLGPVFVLVYAAVATFAAPVAPLAYVAGVLFGFLKGSMYVWVGSLIGGTAGYWVARGVWANPAKRLLGRYEDKLTGLRRGSGFLITLRAQLSPIIPFGVYNYAAGTGKIPYPAYIAGTALGVVPATMAAVYVGERVAAGFRGSGRNAFLVAGAVMLALIGVSFLPTLVKRLRGGLASD